MMMMSVGFRFHPTDRELVEYFLQNRVLNGDEFLPFPIHNYPEFYGQTEPWKIWELFGGNSIEEGEPLFFFTHRKKLNPKAKHFHRKVGSGTWSAHGKDDVVAADGVIGVRREFRYERGSEQLQNGVWLMTEYELITPNDTVLCTLRKSPRAPTLNQNADKKMKRKLKVCEDKEEDSSKRKKLEPPKQSIPLIQVENNDIMPPLGSVEVESLLESVEDMASVATQDQLQVDQQTIHSLTDSPISFEHIDFEDDSFLDFINKNEELLSQFSPSHFSGLD